MLLVWFVLVINKVLFQWGRFSKSNTEDTHTLPTAFTNNTWKLICGLPTEVYGGTGNFTASPTSTTTFTSKSGTGERKNIMYLTIGY